MTWSQLMQLQLEVWQSTLERKSDRDLQNEVGELGLMLRDLHNLAGDRNLFFEKLYEHLKKVNGYILSSKKKLPLPLYKYMYQIIHKKLPLIQKEFRRSLEERQMLISRMELIEKHFVHSFQDIEEANTFVEAVVKNHTFYYEKFTLFDAWKQLLYKPYKNLQNFSLELEGQMDDLTAEYINIMRAWDSLTPKDLRKQGLVRDFASKQESYNAAREELNGSFDVYMSMHALQKEYFEGYFNMVREYILEYYQSLLEELMDVDKQWSSNMNMVKRELFRIPFLDLLSINSLEKFMDAFKSTIGAFFQNSDEALEDIPSYRKAKSLAQEIVSSWSVPSIEGYFQVKDKIKQMERKSKKVFVSYYLHNRKLCTKPLFGMEKQLQGADIIELANEIKKLTLFSGELEEIVDLDRDERALI